MQAKATVGPEARTVHLNITRTDGSPEGQSYPLFISWGDGSAQQVVASGVAASDVTHQYAKAAVYDIVVQGDVRIALRVNVDYMPPAFGAEPQRRQRDLQEDALTLVGMTGYVDTTKSQR